jgi:hypothetical protein
MDLGVVARVHGGHPDLLAAEAQRRLHGRGVDAADVVVQHDPAEHPDAGDDPLHQVGAGHGVLVMALEQDGLQARVAGRPDDVEVVRQPGEQVGVRVAVQVHRAGHVHQRSAVGTPGHWCSSRC